MAPTSIANIEFLRSVTGTAPERDPRSDAEVAGGFSADGSTAEAMARDIERAAQALKL